MNIRLFSTLSKRHRVFTTPIFYVNAEPHLGHLHSAVLCDSMRRWEQIRQGYPDTFLSTGTDEHGVKIQQAALANSSSPKEHVDKVSRKFRNLFDQANVKYDRFIRTTDADHAKAVEIMWSRLKDNGYIYNGKHKGWYSVSDECFYTDIQVMESLKSDGSSVMVSKETGKEVEWIEEDNYIFRLSDMRGSLLEWLKSNPEAILPANQYRQVISWLKDPLPDISVSRPSSRQFWGIKVPNDPEHTIYVWIDALTNYLTVTGLGKTWNLDNKEMVPSFTHVIGKDILRFHAVYWPALLMAAGLPPPQQIISHAHWLFSNEKMSKSLGNVVNPVLLMDTYGVDAVRYYILRDGGVSSDSEFSEDMLRMRYQVELADQLGNLLARCMSKSLNPQKSIPSISRIPEEHLRILDSIDSIAGEVDGLFQSGEYSKALSIIIHKVHETNRYIQQHEPWKLIKSPNIESQQKAQVVLYGCLEALRVFGIVLQHVMPDTMSRMLDMLNVNQDKRYLSNSTVDRDLLYRPGVELCLSPLKQHQILFPRWEQKKI